MRRIKRISNHTFQIGVRILRGDASIYVDASEMSSCGFFLLFLFYCLFLFDPNSRFTLRWTFLCDENSWFGSAVCIGPGESRDIICMF